MADNINAILATTHVEVPMPKAGEILCAHCGSEYVKHTYIDVFQRNGEDALTGLHTSIGDGESTACTDMTLNPSKRRDGFFIDFDCEPCRGVTRLRIVQHKGHAFFDLIAAEIT